MNTFNDMYLFYGTSLAKDAQGNPVLRQGVTIGYTYPTAVGQLPYANPSQLAGFVALTPEQTLAAEMARARWSDVANITWVATPNAQTTGIISIATAAMGAEGSAQPPTRSTTANPEQLHVAISNTHSKMLSRPTLSVGSGGFHTLLHEIGHALGLDHTGGSAELAPNSMAVLLPPNENYALFSVMSYPLIPGNAPAKYPSLAAYPITPMLYDIAAIQRLYGVNSNYRSGSTPYVFTDTSHPFSADTPPEFDAPEAVTMTLWDGDGAAQSTGITDILDARALTTVVLINLIPGEFSAIGTQSLSKYNVGIAFGTIIEDAIGGSASDVIIGNDIKNILEGNGGNDSLNGGAGADELYGERKGSATLNGVAGKDRLDGGTATGQTWDDGSMDTLVGGAGIDTYILHQAAGNTKGIAEKIVDSGANIVLVYNASGRLVSTANNQWYFRNNPAQTVWSNPDFGAPGSLPKLQLSINSAATIVDDLHNFTVVLGNAAGDFQSGDFGIQLRDAPTIVGKIDTGATTGGNDTLAGASGNDRIRGDVGRDTLIGYGSASTGSGDDWLEGGLDGTAFANAIPYAGGDFLYGGDGSDTLFGNNAFGNGSAQAILDGIASQIARTTGASTAIGDVLSGDTGDDVLIGGDAINFLAGGAGGDLIVGGAGLDYIFGGRYVVSAVANWAPANGGGNFIDLIDSDEDAQDGGDAIYAGAGNDKVQGGLGDDYIDLGAGMDVGAGGAGNDVLLGGTIAEVVVGDQEDLLFGDMAPPVGGTQPQIEAAEALHGADFLDGGTGPDVLLGGGRDDILLGGAGIDLLAGDGAINIVGGSYTPVSVAVQGADYLDGGDGDDFLYGDGGNDTLIGGNGNDIMRGGAGRDTYIFNRGDGQDVIIDTATGATLADGSANPEASIIMVGAGIESATFVISKVAATADALIINFGNAATGLADTLTFANLAVDVVAPQNRPLFGELRFASGRVMLWEDVLAQGFEINGTFGSDRDTTALLGTNNVLAGDRLNGLSGNDQIYGYAGNDTLDGGSGNDLLVGDIGNDTLLGGTGDDEIYGGAGDDVADGGANADYIFGNAGADTLRGGTGDDFLYAFDDSNTAFQVDDGNGNVLEGGDGADYLYGAAGNDTLRGDPGDDWLLGYAGNDVLEGGSGQDVLRGFDGADLLYGGDGDDAELDGGAGNDSLIGGRGNDFLKGGVGLDTYVFNRGDGADVILDPDDTIGSSGVSVLTSDTNANASIIEFGAGITRNDLVFSYALPTTDPNFGIWTFPMLKVDFGAGDSFRMTKSVLYFQTDLSFSRQLAELRFADGTSMTWADVLAAGFTLSGTSTNDLIPGTQYAASTIRGLEGNDTLSGGSLNDTLDGGPGDDLLKGGAGNDIYQMNVANANGRDVIDDTSGNNTLRMKQGRAELALTRSGNDLVLTVRGATDRVTLKNGFAAGGTTGWTFNYGDGQGSMPLAGYVGLSALTAVSNVTALIDQFDSRWRATYGLSASPPRVNGDLDPNNISVITGSIVDGAAGNDTLTMNKVASVDYMRGVHGSLLIGGTGNDTLTGGGDDDILTGGTDNNMLDGGNGDDHYVLLVGAGTDTTIDRGGLALLGAGDAAAIARYQSGLGGFDRVYLPTGINAAGLLYSWSDELVQMERNTHATHSGPGAPTLSAGFPTRVLTAMLSITWGNLSQAVKIAMPHSDDPLDFGIEELRFADGTVWTRAQLLSAAGARDRDPNAGGNTINADNVDGEAGNDVLTGNDILRGGEGNDSITGGGGRDAITGDEGVDTLNGGAGADLLGFGAREFKGAGNTYRGGTGNDIVLGSMNSDVYLFDRGDGADSIGDYWHNPGNSPFAQGMLAFSNEWSSNYADVGSTIAPGTDYSGFDTLRLGANIAPSEVAFVRANALVYGTSAGALDPSPAAVAAASGDDLVLTLGALDQVRLINWYKVVKDGANQPVSGGPNRHALNRVEFANGSVWNQTYLEARSGNAPIIGTAVGDSLNGTAGNDYILGLGGNDTLNGGAGADAMEGGVGDDTYVVDNLNDTVFEIAGEGNDYIFASVTHTLELNVENLILSNGAAGIGNDAYNILQGHNDPNQNILTGRGYNDYYMIIGNDVVFEDADGGTWDVIAAFGDHTMEANVEAMVLYNGASGTGNDQFNAIYGDAGNNTLDGKGGADWLGGGGGNDTYVVDNLDDAAIEDADAGTDTVQSSITWTLGTNLERLILTGTAPINGYGNAGANVLNGNAGANVLDGLGGADAMAGGGGDDVYIVDNINDTVTESLSEGSGDYIVASVTHTLELNVETLIVYNGATAIGNNDNNTLQGHNDPFINILRGLGGNDYYVIGGNDVVEELAGGGTWDVIAAMGDHTLELYVEAMVMYNGANGTGNDENNALYGDAGNNTLDGKGGADWLGGGAGDDTYVVDQLSDTVIENLDQGSDTVRSNITWTLGANLEKLVLTGTAPINGYGNSGPNVLTGNAGANLLDGLGGADAMAGGGGDDVYVVDNINDTVTELSGEGLWDYVVAYANFSIGDNIEAVFAYNGANVVGNLANNSIYGHLDALSNRLTGGGGSDFFVIGGNDEVSEGIEVGDWDVISSNSNHTMEANVEAMMMTNGANGTGNAAPNHLYGCFDAGANTMTGTDGSDTYYAGRGGGADTVVETVADGDTDVLQFLAGVATNQIWFRHVGSTLEASILGSADRVTMQNWASNGTAVVEQFKTTDGNKTLSTTQAAFASLVQAMSGITPGAGDTSIAAVTMTQPQRDNINTLLAANWQ